MLKNWKPSYWNTGNLVAGGQVAKLPEDGEPAAGGQENQLLVDREILAAGGLDRKPGYLRTGSLAAVTGRLGVGGQGAKLPDDEEPSC